MTAAIQTLLERPDVQALLGACADAGASARIVGGAVRDAIMGRQPGDIDIATALRPDAVIAMAQTKGWKAVPTGIDHGTVTLILSGRPYEVTTLRRDVETDGRRAVIAFTDDWREDAFRRDFTINALSLSGDGTVHDYATGIDDADKGLVRFMGDPDTRIREDYLRILRFFRFMASHGRSAPDPLGLAACTALRAGLDGISRERVRQELLKLLVAPGAPAAAEAMQDSGLWPHVLPDAPVNVDALRRWVALASVLPEGADAIGALAALTSDALIGTDMAEVLRLSRAEAAHLTLIRAKGFMTIKATTPELRRVAVYQIGAEGYATALRASAAKAGLTPDEAASLWTAVRDTLADPPRNPFRSSDLGTLGVEPGPRMGAILKAAEDAWIDAGLPEDPASTRAILTAAVARN
jgi:poly(A) polymerase